MSSDSYPNDASIWTHNPSREGASLTGEAEETPQIHPHEDKGPDELRRSSVLRNYATVLSGHGISALMTFATSILLARALLKSEFGVYSSLVALIAIFAAVMDIGMTSSLVRFGAKMRIRGQLAELSNLARGALIGKLIVGVLVGVVGLIVISLMPLEGEAYNGYLVLLAPVGGLVLTYFYFAQGALQVNRAFRSVTLLPVLKGALFLGSILVAISYRMTDAATITLLFIITSLAATALFSRVLVKLVRGADRSDRIPVSQVTKLLGFGKWIAVAGMCYSIFEQLPLTIALPLYGPDNAAELAVAVSLVSALSILNYPLQMVLMPDLSSIDSTRHLKRYLVETYRFVIPLALAITAGVYLLAEDAVSAIYGHPYASASSMIMILAIPFVMYFVMLPLSTTVVYVYDKPRVSAAVSLIQMCALLAACFVLALTGDILSLVMTYAVLRAGGTIAVSVVAWRYLRSMTLPGDPVHGENHLFAEE